MKPKIIITENIARELKNQTSGLMPLYGLSRPGESLIQIISLAPRDDLRQIACLSEGIIALEDFNFSVSLSEIETIPFRQDFTSRAQGIVDTDLLAQKKITFIGLGSVGSQMALHLAQSALGRFTLLDPDRLSVSNLSRHACDLPDLERFKTKAVRDLILRRNPHTRIGTFEEEFLSLEWEEQLDRLKDSDLVIASTDSNAVQFAVNEVCAALNVPSLYVGCYERACAGEVIWVHPGKTPCFNCFMEFRGSHLNEIKKKERRIPYSNEEPAGLISEPGLAIDISYTVSVASAYALALLLPDSERGKLLDPERNLILIHSGTLPKGHFNEIFGMPFDLLKAKVNRDKECLVCQKSFEDEGGMNGKATNLS